MLCRSYRVFKNVNHEVDPHRNISKQNFLNKESKAEYTFEGSEYFYLGRLKYLRRFRRCWLRVSALVIRCANPSVTAPTRLTGCVFTGIHGQEPSGPLGCSIRDQLQYDTVRFGEEL